MTKVSYLRKMPKMRQYSLLVLLHFLCMTLLTACGGPMSSLDTTDTRFGKTRKVKPYPSANRHVQPRIVNNPVRSPFWNSMLSEMDNHSQEEIWDEMRYQFKLKHFEEHPEVQAQINWYLNHPSYLQRVTTRSSQYIYYVMQEVKKRNLPAELALLPFIESAYNPFVSSNKGASGLWQLMPQTATGLGIKRTGWYDGRRDIAASTQAALDYLDYLNSFFSGDWFLAIAAYDYGEGNVSNAISRNARQGLPTSFWDLKLPSETRTYVPRLLAFAALVHHPERYMIELPHIKNSPYFAQVEVDSKVKLAHAAKMCDISMNELRSLNPGFKKLGSIAGMPYQLLIPIEKVSIFQKRLAELPRLGKEALNRTLRSVQHKKSLAITSSVWETEEDESGERVAPVREIHTKKTIVRHSTTYAKKSTWKAKHLAQKGKIHSASKVAHYSKTTTHVTRTASKTHPMKVAKSAHKAPTTAPKSVKVATASKKTSKKSTKG